MLIRFSVTETINLGVNSILNDVIHSEMDAAVIKDPAAFAKSEKSPDIWNISVFTFQ
jgi:hypothetical protein